MALQKQFVEIELACGIDTKTDPQDVKPGKLLELENATFTRIGSLTKRYGLKSLGNGIVGETGKITLARNIAKFGNELNLIDDNYFYTYSESSDEWIKKSSISGASAVSTSVIRNTYNQSVPDVAVTQGAILYTWIDSSGGIRASIFDQSNFQPVLNNVLISATGVRPKAASNGDYLYVFYAETATNSLKSRRFNPRSPSAFDAAVTMATNAHGTNPYIDVTKHGANLVLTYRLSSGSGIRTGYIRQDGNFGGLLDGFPTPVTYASDPTNSLAVISYFVNDTINDGIYVFLDDSTNGLRCLIYNLGLSNSPTPVVIDATTTVIRNIAAINVSASLVNVFYELDDSDHWKRLIKFNTITRAGVAGTPVVFMRSVGLQSKPFIYNDKTFIIASHESALQATYFTIQDNGYITNRITYTNGGGNTALQASLANIVVNDSTSFIVPTCVKGPLETESGHVYTTNGVQSTLINFDNTNLFYSVEFGNNLFIAAGMLLNYDGINVTESGFNLYPENAVGVVDNGSGTLIAGQRQWCFLYEWTDQQGNIHRSAPSIPVTYTTAGGTSHVDFTIPTLRLTAKNGVTIVVYRTEANGTTFYRVNPASSPLYNDKTVDTVAFADNLADSSLIANQILYTTGGTLENMAPPSATLLTTYNNRLVIAGLEDDNEIRISKEYVPGEGVGFSDFGAFIKRIDSGRKGITALSVLDDKLVCFKSNAIYVTAGVGALDTGAQDDIETPQFVTSGIGCTESKSIVRMPMGLMFKSSKGIYLLNRQLQESYIGAYVEKYNDLTISNASLVDNTNQVRFTHSDGVCLVYDYFFDQWGIFTNYTSVSSVVWNGLYTIARANGTVEKENYSSYLDNGSVVNMKVVTPWIAMAGLQGFQRVYESIIIGEPISDHILQVKIGYDYEPHYRETVKIDTSTVLGSNYFGQGPYYGSDRYIGGVNDPVYQFKVRQGTQKCEAIRYEISDINVIQKDMACMNICKLALVIGVKGKTMRVPAAKVMYE